MSNETREKEDEESKETKEMTTTFEKNSKKKSFSTTTGGEGVARLPKKRKEDSDTETDNDSHGPISNRVGAGTKTTGLSDDDESSSEINMADHLTVFDSVGKPQRLTTTSMLPEHSFVRDGGTQLDEYPKEMVDFEAMDEYHNKLLTDALATWNEKWAKLEAREKNLCLQKKELDSEKTTKKNKEKKIQRQATLKGQITKIENEKKQCEAIRLKIKTEHYVKYVTGAYDSIESINPIPVKGGYEVVVQFYTQKGGDQETPCNKEDEGAHLVKKFATIPRGWIREMFGETMRGKLKEIQELNGVIPHVIPLSMDNVFTEEEQSVVEQCLKKDTGICEYRKKDELNSCWVISVIHIQCLYSEPEGDYPLIEVEDNSHISKDQDIPKWSTQPFEREQWAITTELYDKKKCNGKTTFGEKWESLNLEFDKQRSVVPETLDVMFQDIDIHGNSLVPWCRAVCRRNIAMGTKAKQNGDSSGCNDFWKGLYPIIKPGTEDKQGFPLTVLKDQKEKTNIHLKIEIPKYTVGYCKEYGPPWKESFPKNVSFSFHKNGYQIEGVVYTTTARDDAPCFYGKYRKLFDEGVFFEKLEEKWVQKNLGNQFAQGVKQMDRKRFVAIPVGAAREHLDVQKICGGQSANSLPVVKFLQPEPENKEGDSDNENLSCIPCSIANGFHYFGFSEVAGSLFGLLNDWMKQNHANCYRYGSLGPMCYYILKLGDTRINKNWTYECLPTGTDIFSINTQGSFVVLVPRCGTDNAQNHAICIANGYILDGGCPRAVVCTPINFDQVVFRIETQNKNPSTYKSVAKPLGKKRPTDFIHENQNFWGKQDRTQKNIEQIVFMIDTANENNCRQLRASFFCIRFLLNLLLNKVGRKDLTLL